MSTLLELQRRFRDALLADDGLPPSEIVGNQVSASARLGIYRNNYLGNLTKVLQLTYPAVERLVGESFFVAAAERFILVTPPHVADLHRYGEGFADFLATFAPAASVPYLADIARLEWAVSCALHAAPAAPLAAETLSEIPPEKQAETCFIAHPALLLLSLDWPARAIWQAVLSDDEADRTSRLADIDLEAGGEMLAVLPDVDGLDVTALSVSVFELARRLQEGDPLGSAIADIQPDDAAVLLAEILMRGLFVGVGLPETRSALA